MKGIPNKKPTDFMVNGEHMASMLSRRCSGGHEHQPLMEGRAALAQHYPRRLCQAMVKGAEKDSIAWRWCSWATEEGKDENGEKDLEEELDDEYEREEASGMPEVSSLHKDEEEQDGEEPRPEDRGVSREDKRLIQRLHNNLGHPRREEFCRALRMARARSEVVNYVKKEFHCPQCEGAQRPSAARPACLPRTFEASHTVGVDVVYFPGPNPRENLPVLNITDWGTGYQSLEPLDNMQSEHVWMKFFRSWVRTFGLPQLLVMDQGREFVGPFARRATEHGCLVKVIGARAPWQQGRTERHGGLAKEVFVKLLEEVGPVSPEEWRTCIYAVEAAKNRLYNRSGFSPAQRQIGANIRLPGTLASDDNLDPALMVHSAGEEVRRMLQIRQAAMEAFLKHTAKAALQRAEHGRSRVMKEFKLGELVYVYRVPLRRRGERENNKPKWVGPGSIIMIEGANVWISMRGELWKCAKEQVRRATSEEEQASEMLKEEYAELKEQLARGSSKRSFQDISGWGIPPEEDDPPTDDSSTTEEPEREVVQEQEPLTDAVIDAAVASRHHNENLDGTLRGRGREDLYGPTTKRLERMWSPYRGGVAPVDEEEEHERGGEADEDYWIYDEDRSSIVRVHQVARRVRFTPSSTRGCPVPLAALTSGRRTYREYGDGSTSTDRGQWRAEVGKKEVQTRWWVGFTEFKLRKKVAGLHLMVKRGSDEVLEKDIKGEEEWEKWRVADGAEWSKVEATGAVRTMSIEESREVEQQLSEAGLQRRILPSRIVRRWKPGDQPGTPPSRKSRWCIRGDKDPDLLDLVRHAPTVTTSTLAIALQICACQGWDAAVGDLRSAFMQSERLVRPSGRLYCQQPKGGLPGLHPEQLIEILAGAYGLGDAPAHWRKTLKKAIFDIGMSQSVLDPTVYKWYDGGVLEGLVVVEVDDLLIMGTSKFFQRFEGLKQRFEFGKFVKVKEQEEGTSFNGRRIRHVNGDFMIDVEKFVKERLEPVSLDRGRKAEDPATPEEKERTRAVVGSLTWAAKEGRPDAAAAASLVASSLANLKVQDIMDLNRAVKIVKQRPDLHLKIQAIDPNRLGWGVVTDASFANA